MRSLLHKHSARLSAPLPTFGGFRSDVVFADRARRKIGEMRVIEAITRGEPIGSLMRIFDTSIPGDDEYDGRNALGCRDLFCEKYFEANPGADVMRDVLRDAADI